MNISIPPTLPWAEGKFELMYEGRRAADRGVSMDAVIRERTPYAIFDIESATITNLRDGSQRTVETIHIPIPGRWGPILFPVLDLDVGTYHSVRFGNREDVVSFAKEHYPGLLP